MEDSIINSTFDVLTPVLESSMVLAAHYAKCCGRDTVTLKDVEYALKYNAMNNVGVHIGSLYPEIYEESDSDSDISVSDEEVEFIEYQGDDEWCIKINESVKNWDTWVPSCPVEDCLKRAIDSRSV